MKRLAQRFFSRETLEELVFEEKRIEINILKKEGHKLILLTGSPSFIGENFKILGFDMVFPTEMEMKNGIFTGELINYPSEKKKRNTC